MSLTGRVLRKTFIGIGVLTILPVLPVADGSMTGTARATASTVLIQTAPARVPQHVM